MRFATLIIGKGLIGSAAAKYLSQSRNMVAIVGPDEPDHVNDAIVYASHYDSGRVQRQVGRNDTMTRLNVQSLQQYRWLQEESGITFHTDVGCLYVNPLGRNAYLDNAAARAERHGVELRMLDDADELANAFAEFRFPNASRGLFEPSPSGYIDPRSLIKAQLRIVERNGGSIIREHARRVDCEDMVKVTTSEGKTLYADKVLLAAGAFTNSAHLLETKLSLVLKSETVILARVSREEAARLRRLPSLLYDVDVPELEGIYSTPPLLYPDGDYYLKVGCNLPEDIFFEHGLEEIQDWFRSGASDLHIDKVRAALMSIMPDLKVEDCVSKRCILTRTEKHGNPYVGRINDQVYVAIGNGWSAMSSDAIGRVATHLILEGEFPKGYASEDFEPVFQN